MKGKRELRLRLHRRPWGESIGDEGLLISGPYGWFKF